MKFPNLEIRRRSRWSPSWTASWHRVRYVRNTILCLWLQQGYLGAVENLDLKIILLQGFRPPSSQADYHNFWVYRIVILYKFTSKDLYRVYGTRGSRLLVYTRQLLKRDYCKGNRSFRWYRESSEVWNDTYPAMKHWKRSFDSLLLSRVVAILDTENETSRASSLKTRIFSCPLWLASREM